MTIDRCSKKDGSANAASALPLMGRVAVVTGGGAGIGQAICMKLARSGVSVAIVDRDSSAGAAVAGAIVEAGGHAIAITADLAEDDAPDRIADGVLEQLGTVAILVNNAGEGGGEGFCEVTRARFDKVFAVSARAPFFLTQRLVPGMKQGGWGRIVNISSLIAVRGAAGNPHYAGAKSALIGFTRCWAQELAPFGVTANVIPVALTDTAMVTAAHGPDFLATRAQSVPAGRVGTAEDVAHTVDWLCSEGAAFVNGQSISPNGAEFTGAL